MKLIRNLGLVLLGLWLILIGLTRLLAIVMSTGGLLLGLLAIAAGGVLLWSGGGARPRSFGFMLLGAWLVLNGLVQITPLRVPGVSVILGLLAISAGIVMLMGVRGRAIRQHPGISLLAAWLIISGLLELVTFRLPVLGELLAFMVLVAGFFILLER